MRMILPLIAGGVVFAAGIYAILAAISPDRHINSTREWVIVLGGTVLIALIWLACWWSALVWQSQYERRRRG